MATHIIHRGLDKKNFKENTLKSFNYCFKKGYGVETDLRCTKDNKIVCFHDFNLKSKFKINRFLKNICYDELKRISKKENLEVPLLKDLIKLSKNKRFLLLEIKPLFNKSNLVNLINNIKKLKKYGLISFKEKNLKNLYKINKNLKLGLLISSASNLKHIKRKSKLKHVKFIVLEKKFLPAKKISKIKKNIFYYTIKTKDLFNKYKDNKNLIFENL